MALAYAAGATSNNNTGTATTGSLGTTATGQLIVVTISDDSATATSVTSVTDNKGNTYTKVPITQGTSSVLINSSSTQMWYAVTTSAGASHTVTVAWNTAATGRVTVSAQYFTGFTSTPTLDKYTAATSTSNNTTANPGTTGTTTQAAEIVVVGAGHAGTASAFSAGAGMSNINQVSQANASVGQASKIVAAIGTQTGTLTIAASRAWGAIIATFMDGAGGGGGSTGQIKAYVSGAFTAKPMKVWNGSSWVTKPVKKWNGSSWVATTY